MSFQPMDTHGGDDAPVLLFVPGGIPRPGAQNAPAEVENIGIGWLETNRAGGEPHWVTTDVETAILSQGGKQWPSHQRVAVEPSMWAPIAMP